jgi:hypothetical protein
MTQLFLFRSVLGERVAARYTYWAVRISGINASNKFRLCRQISSNQRILHVITFIATLPSKMMQAALVQVRQFTKQVVTHSDYSLLRMM